MVVAVETEMTGPAITSGIHKSRIVARLRLTREAVIGKRDGDAPVYVIRVFNGELVFIQVG